MGQGIFISRFRESGTRRIHDPEYAAEAEPRKPIHRRAIGVHLCLSAAKIPFFQSIVHIPPFDRKDVQ